MAVRAKFYVLTKDPGEVGNVRLYPVCKLDGEGNNPDNEIFGKYTPTGELQMNIQNPDAFAQFEPGKEYYIDITPAEAAEAPQPEA